MHAVETMAYAGQVPWHALGTPVSSDTTIEAMQTAAGLDWTVSKRQVRFLVGPKDVEAEFPNQFVLQRDSDHKPFAVVSHRYKPVQPKEILEFYRDLLALQGFTLETAGSLHGGARIWALAKTGQAHKVLGRDPLESYLLLATSYDAAFATLAQFTSVRVVCHNTLQQALGDATGRVTVPHLTAFDPAAIKDELGLGQDQWGSFTKALDVIAKVKLDVSDARYALESAFRLPQDPVERLQHPDRVHADAILQRFRERTFTGADLAGATGWGLVNATTEYIDYQKRARSDASRLEAAWFGEGARIKARVLTEALSFA